MEYRVFEEMPVFRPRNAIIFILREGFRFIVSITACDSECTHTSVATKECLEAITF